MRNFRRYCVDFFEIMYEAPVTICGVVAATYEYCNEFPSDYEYLRLRRVEYEPERDLSKECFNFYDAHSMFLYSISSSGMMHWNGFHTVYSGPQGEAHVRISKRDRVFAVKK